MVGALPIVIVVNLEACGGEYFIAVFRRLNVERRLCGEVLSVGDAKITRTTARLKQVILVTSVGNHHQ